MDAGLLLVVSLGYLLVGKHIRERLSRFSSIIFLIYASQRHTHTYRERERERERERREREREREVIWVKRMEKSRAGLQRMHRLKRETYKKQINDGFWLAGRNSNGKKLLGQWERDRKERKIVSWTPDTTMWRRPKITAPILGCALRSGLTHRCEALKTEIPSKHVRELQQETRKMISNSVSPLFLLKTFYLAKTID